MARNESRNAFRWSIFAPACSTGRNISVSCLLQKPGNVDASRSPIRVGTISPLFRSISKAPLFGERTCPFSATAASPPLRCTVCESITPCEQASGEARGWRHVWQSRTHTCRAAAARACISPNVIESSDCRVLWQNFHFRPDWHQHGAYTSNGFSLARSGLNARAPAEIARKSRVSECSVMLESYLCDFVVWLALPSAGIQV